MPSKAIELPSTRNHPQRRALTDEMHLRQHYAMPAAEPGKFLRSRCWPRVPDRRPARIDRSQLPGQAAQLPTIAFTAR